MRYGAALLFRGILNTEIPNGIGLIYEQSLQQGGAQGLNQHVLGLARMIQHRGPAGFRTDFERTLVLNRLSLIVSISLRLHGHTLTVTSLPTPSSTTFDVSCSRKIGHRSSSLQHPKPQGV